jgi:transposase
MNGIVDMTMVEIDRLTVIKSFIQGEITTRIAALRLQIGARQVRRLVERFVESGAAGLVSRQRGRPSNRQLAPGLAQSALTIIREHYADYGPTLAGEKLGERHGIKMATETVRRLMIEDGLWKTRQDKQARLHQPRTRRDCLGDLIQIDGSFHPWFEDRGPACSLLVFVDDATGRLMQVHFAPTESTMGYFEATRRYIEKHGKPHVFYSDRAGVFKALHPSKIPSETQFARALRELDISLICASSPQAKGRVERMNRSLQDRLVKDLRFHNISSIDEGNAWSDHFIEGYNRQFQRHPRQTMNLHRAPSSREDLSLVLSWREERKLTRKLTVQNKDWIYVLDDSPDARALIGSRIAIHLAPDGTVELRGGGQLLPHTAQPITRRAPRPIEVDSKNLHHIVDKLHQPRKRGYQPTTEQKQQDLAAAKSSAAKNLVDRRKAAVEREKAA